VVLTPKRPVIGCRQFQNYRCSRHRIRKWLTGNPARHHPETSNAYRSVANARTASDANSSAPLRKTTAVSFASAGRDAVCEKESNGKMFAEANRQYADLSERQTKFTLQN
jgi:hypothetical protein